MALEKIQAIVINELRAVENAMSTAMQSDVALIHDVSQHILKGGKRIRPLMVLLISHLVGNATASQITLASVIEFIHTATLLHDDVVDNSTMRRGVVTANNIWGNEASVLVGDFLYSRAFQLLVDMNEFTLMPLLAEAINVMAEGEVLQLMSRHDANTSETTYFKIITAKTAVLFKAACEMAAMLAKTDKIFIQQAANFGHHIGLAFQLIDDALDYEGNTHQLGKNIGDDLTEGKLTLPLIHALQHANAEEKSLISHIIATGEIAQLDKIQHMITQYGSTIYTLDQAKHHQHQAMLALDAFPSSIYKTALSQLAEFILARHY